MIEQISNLSYKSFKNYTSPPNFFKTKNIIFGYNGRGKSSLAKGIIDSYNDEAVEQNSFRLFNRDYIKETLLLNRDPSFIKGVKVTFNKKDAEITRKIRELEEEKHDTETLEKELEVKIENLRNEIDEIHDQNKGKAKIKKKKNNSKMSLKDVFNSYQEDLKLARKINDSDEYIKSFEADSETLQNEKDTLLNTILPQFRIEKITSEDKEFLYKTLAKYYKDTNDIPPLEIIQWLEKGITLHSDTEKNCLFCHNSFDINEVKNRIKDYRENKKQKDINRLEKIKNILQHNLATIEKEILLKVNLSVIEFDSKRFDEFEKGSHISEMKNLIRIIDSKIKDMSKCFEISDCISIFETEIEKIAEAIKQQRTKKINEFDSAINNIETLAKGKIALLLIENNIKDEIDNLDSENVDIIGKIMENAQKDEQIRELRNSLSEYNDFMIFLNMILESLGINIKLVLNEKNYYLQHTIEETNLTIDDISEGEKNLLSLLYFYFELYNDDSQNRFKNSIKLIVIDDPISSLDYANKFYVLEIVKQILNERSPQIFVLTHSWDDFCQISYTYKNNPNVGLFEIYKDSAQNFQSAVRTCSTNISPYNKLFTELLELADKDDQASLTDCDVYHTANSMRRIFEEFLNFKSPNLLPQKSKQPAIEDIFKQATGNEMSRSRKQKLGSFLSFINVLSHRPIKSDEILSNCKFLVQLIKDMDKVHYEAMSRAH